ncbi:MAG: 50S ribosomal protein L4 [bacterium]|nr:50S ribosomal protein L4 [bacterium]
MKTDLYNLKNEVVGSIELPKELFEAKWNPELVRQVILAQLANARRPWAHAKGRGEVRGGGKKPWRQKGTGRARHGSIRSPIWKGGGSAHGPQKERDYTQKVNVKMKRVALFSLLSRKVHDKELKVVDALSLESPKTKLAASVLQAFIKVNPRTKKYDVLLIPDAENRTLSRAARNLKKVKVVNPRGLNVHDIMNYKQVLLDQRAVAAIKEHYKLIKK